MNLAQRRKMVDREHPSLSMTRQCALQGSIKVTRSITSAAHAYKGYWKKKPLTGPVASPTISSIRGLSNNFYKKRCGASLTEAACESGTEPCVNSLLNCICFSDKVQPLFNKSPNEKLLRTGTCQLQGHSQHVKGEPSWKAALVS